MEIYDIAGHKVAEIEVDNPLEHIHLQNKGILVYRILDKELRQLAEGKFYLPGNG